MVVLLEDLTETILIEEGISPLLGLDFITSTLKLDWRKIERIFEKAASEYGRSKAREDEVLISSSGGSVTIPDNVQSIKAVRYGFLMEIPRFKFETFEEEGFQFNPNTRELKIFPPISEIRVSYARGLNITNNVQVTDSFTTVAGETLVEGMLRGTFRAGTLTVTKGNYLMEVVDINSENVVSLSGNLGTGTIDNSTREINLTLADTSAGIVSFSYYPKYKAIVDADFEIGDKIFSKLYAYHLLTAIAAIRAQASQQELNIIDLAVDDLSSRVINLGAEVRQLMKSSFAWNTIISY